MFHFAFVTDFSYVVDGEGYITIHPTELQKLVDYPQVAEEILHFVNDFAVKGTEYAVYVDIRKNKFGRVRVTDRVVYPQV